MFAVLLATTLGAAAVTAGPVATPGRPLLKISNQNNWHSTLMNVHAAGAEEHMHRSLSTSVLKDQPWHMLTGTFVSPCIPLDLEFDAYHVQKGSMIHTAEYGKFARLHIRTYPHLVAVAPRGRAQVAPRGRCSFMFRRSRHANNPAAPAPATSDTPDATHISLTRGRVSFSCAVQEPTGRSQTT